MSLTAKTIRNARPGAKPLKLFDGGGLFLLVSPSGGRWWRMKYRFEGKEKLLSLGTFPEVGLKDARERRDEARKQIAAHVDPSEHRKAVKLAKLNRAANSFEVIAREWIAPEDQRAFTPLNADGEDMETHHSDASCAA